MILTLTAFGLCNPGMKRIQPIGWVIFAALSLAGTLVFVLFNSDFAERAEARVHGYSRRTDYQNALHATYQRQSATVPPGALVMLGDSILQGVAPCALGSSAVNFAIGGDTSFGVLQRLSDYGCVRSARAVLLHVGINDLARGKAPGEVAANIRRIVESVAPAPVIVSAVLPLNDSRAGSLLPKIGELNRQLAAISGARFIDASGAVSSGNALRSEFVESDGQHLNGKGSAAWAAELRRLLDAR